MAEVLETSENQVDENQVDENQVDSEKKIGVETNPAISPVGADGNFTENWRDSLPEDIRDETSLGTCKSLEGMARQYINAQKMIGKDKIGLLGDNPTEAEKNEFYKTLGRPDTPEDYNLKRPDDFPEELFSADRASKAQELFHKIGLTSKQAAELMDFDLQNTLQSYQNIQNDIEANRQETENACYTKYGNAWPQRKQFANVTILEGANGDEELHARIVKQFGSNLDFIEMAANIGSKFAEHGMVTATNIPTPASIQEQIDELIATPEYIGGPNISPKVHKNRVLEVNRKFEEKAQAEGREA